MKAVDLSELLRNVPPESWVALSPEQSRIIAAGKTAKEVIEKAMKDDIEEPVVIWVPKEWIPAVY